MNEFTPEAGISAARKAAVELMTDLFEREAHRYSLSSEEHTRVLAKIRDRGYRVGGYLEACGIDERHPRFSDLVISIYTMRHLLPAEAAFMQRMITAVEQREIGGVVTMDSGTATNDLGERKEYARFSYHADPTDDSDQAKFIILIGDLEEGYHQLRSEDAQANEDRAAYDPVHCQILRAKGGGSPHWIDISPHSGYNRHP